MEPMKSNGQILLHLLNQIESNELLNVAMSLKSSDCHRLDIVHSLSVQLASFHLDVHFPEPNQQRMLFEGHGECVFEGRLS